MVFLNPIRYSALGARLGRYDLAGVWARRPGLLFGLCAVTLIASLMLGGGTRGGFLSDTILELIAIPAFLAALSSLIALRWDGRNRGAEWALILCLAMAILPLMQLVPLPPWIWTRLPHRDQIVGVFDLLHLDLPWLPISVSPTLTWASLLSLVPPLAVFLGVIQLGYRERRLMSLILLGLGIVAAFLGLMQVAQGPSSPWRFFAVTNDSDAVGFFANRNHLAALLYSVLLFGAAWAINVAYSIGSWRDRQGVQTASIVMLTASFLGLVVLIAAEASTRSRAGVGLVIVALFGALALAITDRRRSSTTRPVKLIFGSIIVALMLVVQFSLYRVLDRFEDSLEGARLEFAHNTINAAEAYMPFGSGFGTFVSVYPSFEPPQDALDNKYVNHAHDDLLEVWLEGGIMSLMLMALFVPWLLLMAAKSWWGAAPDARPLDVLLARATTIVIPLIIVHSVVDYPLRTDAMMAVFALSCAILVDPPKFAPRDVNLRLAPAVEISAEEKRRLAKFKGLAVADQVADLLDAPAPRLLVAPNERADEPPVVAEAAETATLEDDLLHMVPEDVQHLPVDLDEIAGKVQRVATGAAARREATERQPSAEEDQAPVRATPSATPQEELETSAERSEQPLEPPSPTHNDNGGAADGGKAGVGDLAYALAQFNRLSAVLVARSEEATAREGEPGASEDGHSAPSIQLAEAARRRMKILHSLKIVQPPGAPTPAAEKQQPAAPQQPRAVDKTPDVSAESLAQPLDPAQRRLKVLRSVEQFIQNAGLATPTADEPPAAAAAQRPEELSSVAQNTQAESTIAHVVPTDLPAPSRESDLSSTVPAPSMPTMSDGKIAAAARSGTTATTHPAQAPVVTDETPRAVDMATTTPDPSLQRAQAESVVKPIIGTEVFAEIARPATQSDRTAPSPTTAGKEEVPPAIGIAAFSESAGENPPAVEIAASAETESAPEQWGNEGQWPQQWQPDAADAMQSKMEPQQSNDEPLAVPAAIASEHVADATPEPAHAARGAKPQPRGARDIVRSSATVSPAKPRPAAKAPATPVESPAIPEKARWGEGIEWPDEWRK